MGCCHSSLESEEVVSRYRARQRYLRQLSEGRQAFAAAHSLYLHFLRSTGAALLQFADEESRLQLLYSSPPAIPPHTRVPLPSPPPPLPPHVSPCSDKWNLSFTASPILPPPPPSPPSSTTLDFWNPFGPPSSNSLAEEWESATIISEVNAASAATPLPSIVNRYSKDSTIEVAVVSVPRVKKDLPEIFNELDEYFLKASMAGSTVSIILEARGYGSSSIHGVSGKNSNYCKSFNPLLWSWSSNPKASSFSSRNYREESSRTSHSCTVEKLYAWEKKLYIEVKNCERAKEEKDRRLSLLRRQEAKGIDYFKIQKNKREIEKLESKFVVSCQAIETTSSEIIRLRDSELFPQLLDLVNGLVSMWSVMYECHHFQTQVIRELEHINRPSSTVPTSNLLRQATQQLEAEVGHWYSAFCNLLKSQRDYIHALVGWLRLSLFHCHHTKLERTRPTSEIYTLCEEWQLVLDKLPHKVASDGIKSLLTAIHAVNVQQTNELRQQKRLDDASKQLKGRSKELRSLQRRYGPYSAEGCGGSAGRAPVMEKKAEVDALRKRVEEEKNKYEMSSGTTRVITRNNLQTGFPSVFEAMAGFSGVCMQAFGSICGHQKSSGLALDFNRILG